MSCPVPISLSYRLHHLVRPIRNRSIHAPLQVSHQRQRNAHQPEPTPIKRLHHPPIANLDHFYRRPAHPLRENGQSLALQHAIHHFRQRTPVVLPATFFELMFIDEQDVVLEACVEMWLEAELHDDGVVVAVDVGVDAVQAFEDLLDGCLEVFRERDADATGEDGFVVDVGLYPCHEMFDVCWRRHFGGFGVSGCGVLPEVFEFVGGFHFGAGLRGAEFCDAAVEEVDLVVEVDDWRCQSFGEERGRVFALPLTASHSFRSSPSGSFTAFLRLPLPSVASANCRSW